MSRSSASAQLALAETADDAPSAVAFALLVLRSRLLILRVMLLALLVFVITTLLTSREYVSSSEFIPQGRTNATSAGMSGLAAQLGLTMASADPTQNPAFYADLIKSRAVLDPTVAAFASELQTAYEIAEGDRALVRERLREKLSRHVAASVDARTGVVDLSVTAPTASLAQRLNRKLLDVLNDFNLRGRQSQASAERVFVEKRLAEVGGDLRAAEDRLADFLRSNRNYQNSPDLSFAYNRLNRQVSDQQQLYSMLEQSYERSKIDEARDTPLVTLIEAPDLPVRPNPRGWGRRGAIALILGLFLGVAIAYARSLFRRDPEATDTDYEQFMTVFGATKRDLRHPHLLFSQILGFRRGGELQG